MEERPERESSAREFRNGIAVRRAEYEAVHASSISIEETNILREVR
jgi:hypothetical protein